MTNTKKTFKTFFFLFCSGLLTSAATAAEPTLTTHGPIPAGRDSGQPGLRYYLPKDLVVVDAKQTVTRTRAPKRDLSQEAEVKVKIERDINASSHTVADLQQFYLVNLQPGRSTKGTLTAQVNEHGFLKSINSQSEGRGGAILKNIVKFASVVLPVSGLFAAHTASDWPNEISACAQLDLRSQPIEVQLVVKRNQDGCETWHQIVAGAKDIAKNKAELRRLELELAKASAGDVAAKLSQIMQLESSIASLVAEKRSLEASLAAKAVQLVKSLGLGSQTTKTERTVVFDLSEVPSDQDVLNLRVDSDGLVVGNALDQFPKAKELLEQTGAVVTLRDVPTGTRTPGNVTSGCGGEQKDKTARIFYRQSRPFLLDVLVVGKNNELQLKEEKLVELIDPTAAPRCLEFASSGLAVRKLQLDFDERGRPTKLDQTAESAAEALTQALSDSAVAARDAYSETLEKLVKIDTSKRALALSDLTAEVDRLKKEKELLDADLALQGATASQDLVLQQKQLEAQLAALNAQLGLQKAQEGADLQLEIARLTLVVQQLQQELLRLQTQQSIDALKKD
jgi:hypothetical protein